MPEPKKHPGIRRHHGAYQLRYWGPDGKQHAESFERLTDARAFQDAIRTDKRRKTWTDPRLGREPLASLYRRVVDDAHRTGKQSERTLIAYDELFRLYVRPVLGSRELARITRADVEDVVAAAGQRSAWRARDVLKLLRMLLNRAVAEEIIGRNPTTGVAAPRVEKSEPWVLTPDEVERLADAVEERWRALVLVAAYSALRWSELVALRVDRLELPRRRLRVEEKITEHGRLIRGEPKTRHSRRSVAIPDFVCFELAEHLGKYPPGRDGLVFTGPKGGPVRRPHFTQLVWRPATVAAGLPGFPFKNMRHTAASLAIAAGANPLLVAARLGHTTTRMVEEHYVSLFEGLDTEIGTRLGAMRRERASESVRLRPDVDQTWTNRGPSVENVVPLKREHTP